MKEPEKLAEPPRYLRFVTALLLGAAATAPIALTACGGDDDAPRPIDAREIPDAGDTVVDGPLPPPDLPRLC